MATACPNTMKSLRQYCSFGLTLAAATLGSSSLRATLDPSLPPSGNFDLTHWYLTLPVDSSGGFTGTPVNIGTTVLSSGYEYVAPSDGQKKYFLTGSDGAMVFQVPWNGAQSSGSPRSELRETHPDGTYYNWIPGSSGGEHILDGICEIDSVGVGKVVIGQIHGKEPNVPAIILRYDTTVTPSRIYCTVYRSPTGGQTDVFYFAGVPLNTPITYRLRMVGSANSVVLYMTVNGVTQSVDMYANDPAWATTSFYFKAGAYYTHVESGVTAQVSFFDLFPSHAGQPTAPAAPSNLAATPGKKKVTLGWTDGSYNETGFKIERSSDGVNFTQIATVGENATSYANSGLTTGATYYYRVRATNSFGNSAYTNVVSATAN